MSRGFGLGVALAVVLGVLAPSPALATLSIHPAYVEFNLDRGRPSETITVTNLTDGEMRYRAHVRHFLYTRDGAILQVEPDEHSLAAWTKLNPKEFTLPGKGSRVIRLSVIPPNNLAPGEYWAAIEFEPLEGRIAEGEDAAGRKVRLEVTASIMVPIVGQVGEIEYGFDLKDLMALKEEGGISIAAHLVNTGTGRLGLKGTFEILRVSGEVVSEGLIGDDTVLAGGERIFTQTVRGTFPDSLYIARVRYSSSRIEKPVAGQTRVAAASSPREPETRP